MGLRLAISVMLLGQLHFPIIILMQLDFMQCHYEHVGTESSKKVAFRARILVELVHSPEQGKNPLDFLKPQQNENFRDIFAH